MIDLGNVRGQRVFYTQGRSLADLIRDGEVVALPDAEQGIIYKRPENCTPVELAAKLTVDEAAAITAKWNADIEESSCAN